MANVWAIFKRELSAYFQSPIAYVVLALFVFIFGWFYVSYVSMFIDFSLRPPQFGMQQTLNVNELIIRGLFLNTGILAVFMLPLITMRSFSEEMRSGTIELLLTSPVSDLQIVLGKFLGAFSLFAAMMGLTLLHMGMLFMYGEPELMPLVAGYIGVLLMGGAFVAVGILFSSLTKNQVIAGFLSLVAFLMLWVIEFSEEWLGSTTGAALAYLSVTKHLEEFAKGVIDTKDVVYYLTFIGFGLFLSKQSLESHRWRG